jgi:glycosyltransferase involved in cell wall biosynthesis
MQILHFVTSLDADLGGPVRALIDLANSLVSIGHTVIVVTVDSSPTPLEWRRNTDSLKVIHVGKLGFFGLALSSTVRDELLKLIQGSDVVHTHGAWTYANILVCRLADRLQKPYVVSLHGMLDEWPMRQKRIKKRIFLALVGNRWLSGASRIHLAAQSELEQSRKWFPRGRGIVIPNVLDMTPFRHLPNAAIIEPLLQRLDPKRARVLFLSRLHPKKGLEVLLRSAALLKSKNRSVSIIVAGEGTRDYRSMLMSLARELSLQDDDIIFLGAVIGDFKFALFRSCDVFALPTLHENFGYVVVEALACGLCVVTTRAVAIAPELYASGAALLADASPEQFADAIDNLLADRKALRERGELGRRRAFEWFDSQEIIRQYEKMYSRCAGNAHEESRGGRSP